MQQIILLHGAIGAADQLIPLETELRAAGHDVFRLSFPGHGGIPVSETFGIPAFAAALESFILEQELQQPAVFGYSMGGYVALYLASQRPGLLGPIAVLAAKYDWTPEGALKESKMLDPQTIEEKVPKFAAALAGRHGADWAVLLNRTAVMMQELGARPLLTSEVLSAVTNQVLVGLGDRDNMVSLNETLDIFKALPAAQLFVLPATQHPIEKVPVATLAQLLTTFFNQ